MADEHRTERQLRGGGDTERTVIGQGVTVTGDITSKGMIQIDGVVDGTVQAAGVTVGRDGTMKGEVRTDKLSVAGTLEGNVEAKDASLSTTANVKAQVTVHGPLAVEEGARLQGDLRCGGSMSTTASSGSGPVVKAESAETERKTGT